jgi:putative transposase
MKGVLVAVARSSNDAAGLGELFIDSSLAIGAPQQAIKNAGTVYKNFFDRLKKGKKGAEVGYPKFKKKGVHDSFRADNGPATKGANAVPVDGKKIRLPIIG